MQTVNDDQESRYNDAVWYFLAEYSLSEFMVDIDMGNELTASLLFQTIQDLGVPPECLVKIERTLTGFIKEAMLRFIQGRLELPVYICLFCQKKTIGEVNSAKTSNGFEGQTVESTQIIHHSDTKMNGGWGYFLIERGGGFPAGSSVGSHNLVDLYLYKEGE